MIRFCFFILFICLSCKKISVTPPPVETTSDKFVPPVSQVNIPVEISISGIEQSINKQVSGLLYEDSSLENNEGDNLLLKVWKQDDILLKMDGDEIHYRIPLKIWAKTGIKIQKFGFSFENYKEGNCAIALNFKSRIFIDTLWNISIKTTTEGYEWLEKPTIRFGSFNFPITFVADRILKMNQEKMALLLDEEARKSLDIKKFVEEGWMRLQRPVQVSDNPPVWLSINPVSVHMLPFSGKTGKIISSIGVDAVVQSRMEKKDPVTIIPLPHLKFDHSSNDNIIISLINDISYTSATMLLERELLGKEFIFSNGKYKVRILGINIYPTNKKLTSQVVVDGSIKGILYLQAIPYYDPLTMSLKLKETEFSIESKNALLKSASWLIKGAFAHKIENNFNYSLKERIEHYKQVIQEQIKDKKIGNSMRLKGSIESLEPGQLLLTSEEIKVIVNARGKISLWITGFD